MAYFGKYLGDSFVGFAHQIIQDQKSFLFAIERVQFGYSFVKMYSRILVENILVNSVTPHYLLHGRFHHVLYMIDETQRKLRFTATRRTADNG
jgi:hypothetical protein